MKKSTSASAKGLRPSPSVSATEFAVGKVMQGNDGNFWKIAKTKDGVKRWNKVTTVTKASKKTPTATPKPAVKKATVVVKKAKSTLSSSLSITQKGFQELAYLIKTGKHLTPDGPKLITDANKYLYGKNLPFDNQLLAYRLSEHLKFNKKGPFVTSTLNKYRLRIDYGGKEVVKK